LHIQKTESSGGRRRGKRQSAKEKELVGFDIVADHELDLDEVPTRIKEIEAAMKEAAEDLRFEDAAKLRDRLRSLEARRLEMV